MAGTPDSKHNESKEKNGGTEIKGVRVSTIETSFQGLDITRLPTEDDAEQNSSIQAKSTFHIYQKHECHKCISPSMDISKERISGPTLKEQKARRKEKKERMNSGLPHIDPDDNAFFLHRPYLAFHVPPRVLYMGNSKRNAKPAVLIHGGCFWRSYKLQLGASLSKPGVIDPRGVVAWRHHGGDKKALKADDRKLKGYRVRTWRLWGETGKDFVHSVKANREAGRGPDPDMPEKPGVELEGPSTADEVVHLRWQNPISRHTRCYHFQYAGIDFYWKGTGSVRESRTCGLFLRFNHLKLVAKLPVNEKQDEAEQLEVCLGTYTSSVASKKNGTLEFADAAILGLIDEHVPWMLPQSSLEMRLEGEERSEGARMLEMKKSTMYQVFVATAMCMIISEKEKRHTLLDLLMAAATEGGGGAGG